MSGIFARKLFIFNVVMVDNDQLNVIKFRWLNLFKLNYLTTKERSIYYSIIIAKMSCKI